jgi:hypothetical protein
MCEDCDIHRESCTKFIVFSVSSNMTSLVEIISVEMYRAIFIKFCKHLQRVLSVLGK